MRHFARINKQFKYYMKLLKRRDFRKFSLDTLIHKLQRIYNRLKPAFGNQLVKKAFTIGFITAGLISNAQNVNFANFSAVNNPFNLITPNSGWLSPAFGDLDDDGDFDLILGFRNYIDFAYGGTGFYYAENIGTPSAPNFAPITPDPFGARVPGNAIYYTYARMHPTLEDLDHDGDLDLIAVDREHDLFYWENTGTSTLPNFSAGVQLPGTDNDLNSGIDAVDLDDDGDLDLVTFAEVSIPGLSWPTYGYWHENTGSANAPNFAPAVPNQFSLPYTSSATNVEFVDMDYDGDLDILLYDYNDISSPILYCENVGTPSSANFAAPQSLTSGIGYSIYFFSGMDAVDIDNDGDLDFFMGGYYNTIKYWENIAGPLPPPYDEPSNAQAIIQIGNSGGINSNAFLSDDLRCNNKTLVNNEFLTANGANEASCGGANGKSAWYVFTTPGCDDGTGVFPYTLEISTDNPNTNIDTKIELFSEDNGTFTSIACNDDGLGTDACSSALTGASTITTSATLQTATTYYILVDEVGGDADGNYELSVQANIDPPMLSFGSSNKLAIEVPDVNAIRYVYRWRPAGSNGHAYKYTSSNSYEANVPTNQSFVVQVGTRCNSDVWLYGPTATITVPSVEACETPINDATCTLVSPGTVNLSWTAKDGLYTDGGSLSGYLIYYRISGTSGYSYISNPSVSEVGDSRNYNISGLNPGASYEFWVRSRCTSNKTVMSNITSCAGARPDAETSVYSFELDGIQYEDVKLTEDWQDFGVNVDQFEEGHISIVNGKLEHKSNLTSKFDISLQPNPALGNTTLFIGNHETESSFKIFTLSGKMVQNGFIAPEETQVKLELNTGLYIVEVSNAAYKVTKKLVVL